MSRRSSPPHGRTWAQRLVLAAGVLVVLGCASAAGAAAYLGLRFAEIDRVDNIALEAIEKGEPANYLIVGTDSRAGLDPEDPDAGGLLGGGETGCNCTDTIMIVRVDPDETTANVLSLPRDLWLPIADNGRRARINSAHARGEQVLIDTIQESFGIAINHYVEIDFVGFERLVDAVGGIPLWFDRPVRDTHVGLSVPDTGCQVLDGEEARKFARSRYLQYKGADGRWRGDPTADFGRITRQQIFIRRAVDKAVAQGLGNPLTLNRLVSAGVENVRLDEHLDASALIALGQKFRSFDSKELIAYTIPTESHTTSSGAAVQLPLMRQAEPILNVFRGLPPGSVSPKAIELTVLNGSQQQGQAADAAGALQTVGFDVVEVGDYPDPVGRTTVLFGEGGEDVARTVARHVSGGAALVFDEDVDDGAAVLVTGADFTTVHDQPAPEGSPDDLAITTSSVPGGSVGDSTTSSSTTTTTVQGYATGEPPPGVDCG
ncbi:MAG TPA: LCP family protein [Acidimicrobiales bacterium]|nr:LCP family protein [Acidimicrobiales bacterium]